LKTFDEVISDDRAVEIKDELIERGLTLSLNFYRFSKLNAANNFAASFKQSDMSIEEFGIQMTTPMIKSILDVIFAQNTQDDDIHESDLVVCNNRLNRRQQLVYEKMLKKKELTNNGMDFRESEEQIKRRYNDSFTLDEEPFQNEEETDFTEPSEEIEAPKKPLWKRFLDSVVTPLPRMNHPAPNIKYFGPDPSIRKQKAQELREMISPLMEYRRQREQQGPDFNFNEVIM